MRRARGDSLIEVMVSLVIFSIGALGLISVQSLAIATSVSAEFSSQAMGLANEVVSQIWISKSYSLTAAQISSLLTQSGLNVVSGCVYIDASASPLTTVNVYWTDPHRPIVGVVPNGSSCAVNSSYSDRYFTRFQMP
jgi:type IV pilus assembly protein PilV